MAKLLESGEGFSNMDVDQWVKVSLALYFINTLHVQWSDLAPYLGHFTSEANISFIFFFFFGHHGVEVLHQKAMFIVFFVFFSHKNVNSESIELKKQYRQDMGGKYPPHLIVSILPWSTENLLR